MRRFGTRGPVNPEENYVVSRAEEIADFITRVKEGRYIVLFAPRQTGKTTFFKRVLDALATGGEVCNSDSAAEAHAYFPIQLNFDTYLDLSVPDFYAGLYEDIREEIENIFQRGGSEPSEALTEFLDNTELTNAFRLRRFFSKFARLLHSEYSGQKVVLIIDEFDGIPQDAVSGFLNALRHIYLTGKNRCIHSVGIVGVKNITQLDYDRSISPFKIQDEFSLSNFTFTEVRELLSQYTDEVGQAFEPEVVKSIYKQTAGQPFLVNRFAQILTEELDIPKIEPIRMAHFLTAHSQMLEEGNTNMTHLITNIHRNPRFKSILMHIASYESRGVRFNLDNHIINELATYGVIARGADGLCNIVNSIYQHRIMQAFKPPINGLEHEYFPEDNDFGDYLTPTGHIDMARLLDNFRDFVARAGFRILQVPDTPQEYIGQDLLYAYLDQFVSIVRGAMCLEVQTGRGKIDLLIFRNGQKYIVETKLWEGLRRYEAGKKQLAAYVKLERAPEGYYVVFDHRNNPVPLSETETVNGVTIRSYVIPVVQERPSSVTRAT